MIFEISLIGAAFVVNVPLNNPLQSLDVDEIDQTRRAGFRKDFERRWNRSNRVRTGVACLASVLLMVVLWRL